MSLSQKLWEENPLARLADNVRLKNPAMYLIALREHLTQGRIALGDMVNSVAEAFPEPVTFLKPARISERDSEDHSGSGVLQ